VKDEEPHSLGNITFRWMLQEIYRSQCGILFDYHALRDLGIPTDTVPPPSGSQSIIPTSTLAPDGQNSACTPNKSPRPVPQKTGVASFLRTLKFKAKTREKETLPDQASKPCADLDEIDVLEPTHDQMVANPLWWLLQTPIRYPGEFWCVSLLRTN